MSHSTQAILRAVNTHPTIAAAAASLNMPRTTLQDTLARFKRLGITAANPDGTNDSASLKAELVSLRRRLDEANARDLNTDSVRQYIFQLSTREPTPPAWLNSAPSHIGAPGVPTLLISDFHWGEVVSPENVNNHNSYNLEIARTRLETLVTKTIDLCHNHMVRPEYPGIVVALAGDMVSGDIHEELAESNEGPTMSYIFDLFDHLVASLDRLIAAFGNVFVPCVYGNHGRTTHRPRYKGAAHTNFDWLLYNMLERHYRARNESRIRFAIPTGFDLRYNVAGTTYLLTHGDRLGTNGGDGQLGVLAPIQRGAKKTKASYAAMGKDIDYIVMGHWHQHMRLPDAFVNGSGKGYDEFAMGNRFSPELPTQALWFTHPIYGVTISMPIFLEKPTAHSTTSTTWTSWES